LPATDGLTPADAGLARDALLAASSALFATLHGFDIARQLLQLGLVVQAHIAGAALHSHAGPTRAPGSLGLAGLLGLFLLLCFLLLLSFLPIFSLFLILGLLVVLVVSFLIVVLVVSLFIIVLVAVRSLGLVAVTRAARAIVAVFTGALRAALIASAGLGTTRSLAAHGSSRQTLSGW
jgi:hypothetical protein